DSAVVGPHSGAKRIKDAYDSGVQSVIPVIGHRHGLREALGFVVDAARADRIDVAPVVLGLGRDERVPIDLGRAGQQKPGLLGFGQPQRLVRAQSADLQGRNGKFEVVLRASRRGEVHHGIQGAFDVQVVADVVVDEDEALVTVQVGQIVYGTHDQVVNAHY